MKARRNDFLSLLLVICLVAGLMPTTVFAANSGKAIQLGTDALNESINSTNAATVYFGQNDTDQPGAWRVIGYNGNGVASAQGDMTLLAAGNMGLVQFSTNRTNTYADSNLKAAIDALAEKADGGRNCRRKQTDACKRKLQWREYRLCIWRTGG